MTSGTTMAFARAFLLGVAAAVGLMLLLPPRSGVEFSFQAADLQIPSSPEEVSATKSTLLGPASRPRGQPSLACSLGEVALHNQVDATMVAYVDTHFAIRMGQKQVYKKHGHDLFNEVMNQLHGRNIWEVATLNRMFSEIGISTPQICSPSDAPHFMTRVITERKPRFVLEVGVFLGKTTIHIAQELNKMYDPGTAIVMSLDTWLGDAYMWSSKRKRKAAQCADDYFSTLKAVHGMPLIYYQYLYNVMYRKVENTVIPFPFSSSEAARVMHMNGWRPDLIYIDASHDAVDVIQDLEHFWLLLNCGGTMFGDDYHWNQVKMAVNAFACTHGLNVSTTMIRRNDVKWMLPPKQC